MTHFVFLSEILHVFQKIALPLQAILKNHLQNRDVAQLVAHYVRDVGVGRSSRLIPTKGDKGVFSFAAFSFSMM